MISVGAFSINVPRICEIILSSFFKKKAQKDKPLRLLYCIVQLHILE